MIAALILTSQYLRNVALPRRMPGIGGWGMRLLLFRLHMPGAWHMVNSICCVACVQDAHL
jgi:hypothetical protein